MLPRQFDLKRILTPLHSHSILSGGDFENSKFDFKKIQSYSTWNDKKMSNKDVLFSDAFILRVKSYKIYFIFCICGCSGCSIITWDFFNFKRVHMRDKLFYLKSNFEFCNYPLLRVLGEKESGVVLCNFNQQSLLIR